MSVPTSHLKCYEIHRILQASIRIKYIKCLWAHRGTILLVAKCMVKHFSCKELRYNTLTLHERNLFFHSRKLILPCNLHRNISPYNSFLWKLPLPRPRHYQDRATTHTVNSTLNLATWH